MKKIILLITIVLLVLSNGIYADSSVSKPEFLTTGEESGFYMSDAVFFDAKSDKAVVFVPGFIFNKESWFSLAKPLQTKGVASLSLSAKKAEHVGAAILLLKEKGYKDISLVGGSSGAVAILNYMNTSVEDSITKIVLLSPVKGDALSNKDVEKLYMVSRDEKSYEKVNKLFAESEEPKKIEVIPGEQHAQFLLFGSQKDTIKKQIIDYLSP